ncbi:MAG: hypothetical protein AAF491_11275, partial [Verrucomicrobiota bacterium]
WVMDQINRAESKRATESSGEMGSDKKGNALDADLIGRTKWSALSQVPLHQSSVDLRSREKDLDSFNLDDRMP